MNFIKLCLKSIFSVYIVFRRGRRKTQIPPNISSTTICNILGNGPSLNEEITNHIDEIENGELIVVNHFAQSNYFEKMKPRYYVFADPAFWLSLDNSKVMATLKIINEKTNWRLSIFVPFAGRAHFGNFFAGQMNITIHYYNNIFYYGGFNFLRIFLYNRNFCFPVCQNVLVPAIFIAIKMNYRTINLFGADHSWMDNMVVNENNEVCLVDNHFYGESKLEVWRQIDGSKFTMSHILFFLSRMFKGYEEIVLYLNSINSEQKIYNRTKGSFIDAFERKL